MVVGELGHEILILGQRVMGQYAHSTNILSLGA